MRRAFAAALAGTTMIALALGACAKTTEEPAPPPVVEAVPSAPIEAADECHAAQYHSLIGQKKADVPAQPAGATWRVTCTTCPVTMDYRPDRLNILYDEKTEVIEQVKCG